MNWVVFGIGIYIVGQLVIGFVVSRFVKTEADYLVAGRRLGYTLATFTIFATWFGAETCIGAAGVMYEDGLSGGSGDPFGYGLCLLVMGLVFAKPLWDRKLLTFGDLFRQRYGGGVERLAAVVMIPTSLLWAGAQVRAFGQVLSSATDIEVNVTITLAAGVVILYTVLGGLWADAWSDLIQGSVLVVGLIVLAGFILLEAGTAPFRAIEASQLSLFTEPDLLAVVESWAAPICGSVLAAELVARVVATRSPHVAQRSAVAASGLYLLMGTIPVAIGLAGASLLAGADVEPDAVLPQVARTYLPAALYVLFAGALVSAMLSTVDSCLLVAGSLASHNLVVPLRPAMTDRGRLLTARVFVVTFGAVAYVMALSADRVYDLVLEASSLGSAGIFVTGVAALFVRRGHAPSAYAAIGLGLGVYVLLAHALPFAEIENRLTDVPYLSSLAAALLGYVALSPFGRPADPAVRPSP